MGFSMPFSAHKRLPSEGSSLGRAIDAISTSQASRWLLRVMGTLLDLEEKCPCGSGPSPLPRRCPNMMQFGEGKMALVQIVYIDSMVSRC